VCEREREREKVCVLEYVCVCVCVREREKEREIERRIGRYKYGNGYTCEISCHNKINKLV
jgi:hypothetical protein